MTKGARRDEERTELPRRSRRTQLEAQQQMGLSPNDSPLVAPAAPLRYKKSRHQDQMQTSASLCCGAEEQLIKMPSNICMCVISFTLFYFICATTLSPVGLS